MTGKPRRGRPAGHVPANKGRALSTRPAPRTSVGSVRKLMTAMDKQRRPMKEVADAIGCTTASLSRWRHGHSAPSMQDFEAMAQVLGFRLELVPIEKGNEDEQ